MPSDEYIPTFGAPRESEYVHRDRLGAYTYNLGVTTDYFRMRTGIYECLWVYSSSTI